MALTIRLRPQGRKNRTTYRLVVTDKRSPSDGKYVEMVGWYSPFENKEENAVLIKEDRIQHWLEQGAQMTDKARSLVAKLAPAVVKQETAKVVAHRAKMAAKRKARKKAEVKK